MAGRRRGSARERLSLPPSYATCWDTILIAGPPSVLATNCGLKPFAWEPESSPAAPGVVGNNCQYRNCRASDRRRL